MSGSMSEKTLPATAKDGGSAEREAVSESSLIHWTNAGAAFPPPHEALPGRTEKMRVAQKHFVSGHALSAPYPSGLDLALFGFGCFWGAEKCFWLLPGVYATAVGYAGGYTPNPTYEEVCSGRTGHNEVVRVVFDPKQVTP